jgi:hypothetical protein
MSSSSLSSSSSAASVSAVQCVLDRQIINQHTINEFDNLGLSIFAPLCGMNRGSFVVSPPDGQTYSCLHLPSSFATSVGIIDVPIHETNDIRTYSPKGMNPANSFVHSFEEGISGRHFFNFSCCHL